MDERTEKDLEQEGALCAEETPVEEAPVEQVSEDVPEDALTGEAPAEQAPAQDPPAQKEPEKEPEAESEQKPKKKEKKKSKKQIGIALVAVAVLLALLLSGAVFAYQHLFAAEEIVGQMFSHGLLAVQNTQGKWGYINEEGEQVIPFWFDEAYPFHHKDRAIVKLSDMYCFIDRDGNGAGVLADDIAPFGENGLAAVAKRLPSGIKWGYVNEKGDLVIDYQFDQAEPFSAYNRAAVERDGRWGVINKKGEFVIEPNYESVTVMYDSARICVENDGGGLSLFDKNGKVIVNFGVYDAYATDYAQGRLAVAKKMSDGTLLWGYVDEDGIEVIVCQYEKASAFAGGFAAVYSADRELWGHVDRDGVLVGDYLYEEEYVFEAGYAVVKQDGKYGVVNKKGETVFAFENDGIEIMSRGLVRAPIFLVQRAEKVGALGKKGTDILSFTYDGVLFSHGHYFAMDMESEKVTEYGRNGKVVHEFIACQMAIRFADGYYLSINSNDTVTVYGENYKVIGNYEDVCPSN